MAYIIATDSGSDLLPPVLEEWGVIGADLTFRFDGEDKEYTNGEMSPADFYDKMRAGGLSRTAAVNTEAFKDLFRPVLEAGDDLLYIGFDSGISSTSEHGIAAAIELREEFPERTIEAIDTLAATGSQALLVKMAVDLKAAGADLKTAADFIRNLSPSMATWFTVDTLTYLKRGGRISAASAFAGNLLGIRPVMHVEDDGKLGVVSKARGRKASLAALADEYLKHGMAVGPDGKISPDAPGGAPYSINQGDAMEDAKYLEQLIFEKTGRKAEFIMDMGPVIGSHTGPGIMVLNFPASQR